MGEAQTVAAASALALVPAACRPLEDHRHGARGGVREDLRLIRFAERLGYEASFRDGNWCHAASFTLGATSIWLAARWGRSGDGKPGSGGPPPLRWQAKTVRREADGVERYEREARQYGPGLLGLKAALKAEWRARPGAA